MNDMWKKIMLINEQTHTGLLRCSISRPMSLHTNVVCDPCLSCDVHVPEHEIYLELLINKDLKGLLGCVRTLSLPIGFFFS